MIGTIYYSYAYIPSMLIIAYGLIIIIGWALGTDYYDKAEKSLKDADFNTFCFVHLVCSIITIIMWFAFKDVDIVRFINYLWNTWLLIVFLIFIVFVSHEVLKILRNYCLTKRGKK